MLESLKEALAEGRASQAELIEAGELDKVPSEEVWAGTELLLEYLSTQALSFDIPLGTPDIGPCRNGSIDVYWKNGYTLLLNVHEDGISYYGDTKEGVPPNQMVKGSTKGLSPFKFRWMLFWMRDIELDRPA